MIDSKNNNFIYTLGSSCYIFPEKQEHSSTKNFKKCHLCHQSVYINLEQHLLVFHHRCIVCKETFNLLSELVIHMNLHTENFKCLQCQKSFVDQIKLDKHELSKICAKLKTPVKKELMEVYPFICNRPQCERKYKYSKCLKSHIKKSHPNFIKVQLKKEPAEEKKEKKDPI